MEEDAQGRDVQNQGQSREQQVPKDRRKYMRTRKVGAVDSCWNLLEFRHKDVLPASLWGSRNIGVPVVSLAAFRSSRVGSTEAGFIEIELLLESFRN